MDDDPAIPHIHVVPVDDSIEHENSEDCICGPDVEFRPGSASFFHHYLLPDPQKEKAAREKLAQQKARREANSGGRSINVVMDDGAEFSFVYDPLLKQIQVWVVAGWLHTIIGNVTLEDFTKEVNNFVETYNWMQANPDKWEPYPRVNLRS